MNLSESLKHVLKTKGISIAADLWQEDVKGLLKDFFKDFSELKKNHKEKFSLVNFKESTIDTFVELKDVPRRVKTAFSNFVDELLKELEQLEDPKDKAVFCFKVLGGLSAFAMEAAYNTKKARTEFSIGGLKKPNVITQFLVMEMILKVTQLFTVRLLGELENHLTVQDDLKRLRYFKQMISSTSPNYENEINGVVHGDKALEIVENLKKYLWNGKKS